MVGALCAFVRGGGSLRIHAGEGDRIISVLAVVRNLELPRTHVHGLIHSQPRDLVVIGCETDTFRLCQNCSKTP